MLYSKSICLFSSGGIVLASRDGKIVFESTLDARLEVVFRKKLPEVPLAISISQYTMLHQTLLSSHQYIMSSCLFFERKTNKFTTIYIFSFVQAFWVAKTALWLQKQHSIFHLPAWKYLSMAFLTFSYCKTGRSFVYRRKHNQRTILQFCQQLVVTFTMKILPEPS